MRQLLFPLMLALFACHPVAPPAKKTAQPTPTMSSTSQAQTPSKEDALTVNSSFIIFLDQSNPEPEATNILREVLMNAGSSVQTKDEVLTAWESEIAEKLAKGQITEAQIPEPLLLAEWFIEGEFEVEGTSLTLDFALMHIKTEQFFWEVTRRVEVSGSLEDAKAMLVRETTTEMLTKIVSSVHGASCCFNDPSKTTTTPAK